MKFPKLKIGDLVPKFPIVQGGMSIRVSTGKLAGAVAAAGGIGVIGASGMAFDELRREIKEARSLAQGGIVGINVLFAAREFLGIVKTAIEEKIDFVTTGAGFSRDVFKLGKTFNVPILPIVSSARLALTAKRLGAAAIVVEGKGAGGHLGTIDKSVEELLPAVKEVSGETPVIAAGGIVNGQDMAKMFKLGANGVQLATRFVLAKECNVAKAFQKLYQDANKKEDVILITSPVGLPGRAIRNKFSEKINKKEVPKPEECDFCLKNCSYEYCIIKALINAQEGRVDEGVVFAGENLYRIKDRTIKPAQEIMDELVHEFEGV